MDNKNVFANNLKKQMELKGVSRKDLSEALGISYFTITAWVNSTKYPRMDKVEMLANFFGILKSDLIENKASEEKEIHGTEFGLNSAPWIFCLAFILLCTAYRAFRRFHNPFLR